MATKPKNTSTKSSTKKKTTSRKKLVRKKRRTKKKSTGKKYIFIILVLLTTLAIAFFLFLSFDNKYINNTIKTKTKTKIKTHYSTQELLDDLAEIKVKTPISESIDKATNIEIQKKKQATVKQKLKSKKENIAFKERGKKEDKSLKKKKENVSLAYRGKKPRLAILIDDVHTKAQIQAIQNIGLKITPSIFPPYILSPKSHLLANHMKHAMIHLPMESGSVQFNKQTKTLMTSFSDERIADRVMEIRQLFPHAKYVNNHTGSVFTSDYKAMKKLYIALKMEGFVFVDSFTVATSKVKQIAHEMGDAYVRRDIFIDNTHKIAYIHKQLKLAVKKAKKNGYAIAIGHPHKVTMKAIKSAKEILKDVELVYIDAIYK